MIKVANKHKQSTSVRSASKTIAGKKPNQQFKKIVERENITEYRLANGLKVLLLPNDSAPVVTVLVLFKVGSRNEAVGFTGATHFLEHMLFKGTKKHNAEKGMALMNCLRK